MRRYFAFGCSYTHHCWASVPDFIAVNFDEYRNFGTSGGSNPWIADCVLRAHEKYKFTKDDFITVGTTGVGRFSYYDKDKLQWINSGDSYPLHPIRQGHPALTRLWAEKFDSHYFASYRSLLALKWIKLLLDSVGVPYKIYGAVENILYVGDNEETDKLLEEFYSLHDISETIDAFTIKTKGHKQYFGYKYENGIIDNHPSQEQFYRYFEYYFPEFCNDKTASFLEYAEHSLNLIDIPSQATSFTELKYRHLKYIEEKI